MASSLESFTTSETEKTKLQNRHIISLKIQKTVRCENCFVEADYGIYLQGWVQCGVSKCGTAYQKSGIAWWCPKPECQKTLQHLFSG
jgi:hypothetical protein